MSVLAIDEIRSETLTILSEVIEPNSGVAIADFPNYVNAGDVLIYRGQLGYLDALHCHLRYACEPATYNTSILDSSMRDGPILLQGGGNFGDRYPSFQLFRERVIADNPHRAIVQMPQTCEYSSPEALRRTQQVYGAHDDLTILIRDEAGVDEVAGMFPRNRVRFCPDMAFGVGALYSERTPDHDVVLLKRLDDESAHSVEALPPSLLSRSLVHDWRLDWFGKDLRWWPRSLSLILLSKIPHLRHRISSRLPQEFDRQSQMIVNWAIDTLSRGRVVVTDRLHAAILAILLDKPVVVVDNNTNKVSRAYHDYLQRFSSTHLAADFDEADRIALQIASDASA